MSYSVDMSLDFSNGSKNEGGSLTHLTLKACDSNSIYSEDGDATRYSVVSLLSEDGADTTVERELLIMSKYSSLRIFLGACGCFNWQKNLNQPFFMGTVWDLVGNFFQIVNICSIAWIIYVVVLGVNYFQQCLLSPDIRKEQCVETFSSEVTTYSIFFLQTISTRIATMAVQQRVNAKFQRKACEAYLDIMRGTLKYVASFWIVSNFLYLSTWYLTYYYERKNASYKLRRMIRRVLVGSVAQSFLLCPALAFILTDSAVAEMLVKMAITQAQLRTLTNDGYWKMKRVLKRINEKSFYLTGQIVLICLLCSILSIVLLFIPFTYYCSNGDEMRPFSEWSDCKVKQMGIANKWDFLTLFVQIISRDFTLLGMICSGIVKINERGADLTRAVLNPEAFSKASVKGEISARPDDIGSPDVADGAETRGGGGGRTSACAAVCKWSMRCMRSLLSFLMCVSPSRSSTSSSSPRSNRDPLHAPLEVNPDDDRSSSYDSQQPRHCPSSYSNKNSRSRGNTTLFNVDEDEDDVDDRSDLELGPKVNGSGHYLHAQIDDDSSSLLGPSRQFSESTDIHIASLGTGYLQRLLDETPETPQLSSSSNRLFTVSLFRFVFTATVLLFAFLVSANIYA